MHILAVLTVLGLLQITPAYQSQRLYDEGVRLMQVGRLEEAAVQFQKALQADGRNVDASVALSVDLCKTGKFSDAVPYFALRGADRRLPQVSLVSCHI